MKGKLILEDGKVFEGNLFGDMDQIEAGEVVFNTSMTGYQEILTDPSYFGQIIVMTYPLIGNYGANKLDVQSKNIQVKGFVVREKTDFFSNWQAEFSIDEYLKKEKIIGIENIDTRALTKYIRKKRTMTGIITTMDSNENIILENIKKYSNKDAVKNVTTKEIYKILGENKNGKKIAVIDFGIKNNILNQLKKRAKELKVFPADFVKKDILDYKPDGLFLSNGPGDPEILVDIRENLKDIVDKYPTFGICLGHQLLGLIYGLSTKKMTFGHRGANHPVINTNTNKVYITAQNHGYEVIGESSQIEVLYKNVNDNSIEGLKVLNKPIFSVQFHPEASPGPHDTLFLFDEFIKIMEVK